MIISSFKIGMKGIKHLIKILHSQNSEGELIKILKLPSKNFNYIINRLYCQNVTSNLTDKDVIPVDFSQQSESLALKKREDVLLPTYNFAAYANKSPILQEFIKLGVKLYEIEKKPNVGEFLLRLDFEKHVKPYLIFLKDVGLPPDRFGKFITKNPLIFKETLDDLNVRINYLESKKFTQEMISNIITKNPLWLSKPVKEIDKRLGYLQQTFKLKGDEVRQVISQAPNLVTVPKVRLMTNTYTLKEEIALDERSLKKIILKYPSVLKKDEYSLVKNFEFATDVMKVQKYLIIEQPIILTSRSYIIKNRHFFLQHLGRAQYNPLLPGYISLEEFCTLSDNTFCEKVAKTSEELYDKFLKSL